MEKISKISRIVKKLYYIIFIENFNNKISYNFPPNYFRWDLIKYLNEKYNFKSYLEIGCDNNQLFSRINIKKKFGVDPSSGGNIRKTSDEFFKNNKKKFDIIFIDGLHEYSQVKTDIINSLNSLNSNGVLLLHDCFPLKIRDQMMPRSHQHWNGDTWKALVETRTLPNLDTYTILADEGIGVVFKRKNRNPLHINFKNFKSLKFKDYYNNYEKFMNPVSEDKFFSLFK